MVELVRFHRLDHANFIDDFGQMRNGFGKLGSRFARAAQI